MDLDRIGLFSEMGYISSGEPYPQRRNGANNFSDSVLNFRSQGKQFLTNPPRKGHDNKDAYFDREYIRLFENEPYTDLVGLRRRWRLVAKEKNITNSPFKPFSVPPKPSGKGSLYGTIEQQWPLHKSEAPTEPDTLPKKPHSATRPNFYTKPPKQGTGYGYPNVTIGKQYEYMSDPYDRMHEAQKNDREYHKKRQIGEKVFISSTGRKDFFNPFTALIEPSAKKEQPEKPTKLPIVPFKPSSCCGFTINKYPTYEAPTKTGKPDTNAAEGNEDGEKKIVKPQAPVFRPSGVSKSYPSRSIIEANCPIAPPSWVQDIYANSVRSGDIKGIKV
ncbi:hypothetical protein HK098_004946 [Nowakowskiella sp. JEL0407]|nr:hypothetical protein HK098_004946 [Nowakowskiella sp. JEL0407]